MTKTLTKILPLAAALTILLPAASAFAAPKPKVQFSSSAYAVTEDAGSATITVLRPRTGHSSVRLTKSVTVDYSATAATAVAGTDFTPVSGTLSFPACADGSPPAHDACIEQTFSVPVLDDSVVDGPKTVNLRLSHAISGGVRAILSSPSSAVLVIADDDPGAQPHPTFQLAMATDIVSEGAPSATAYAVRSGDLADAADVNFATADGTALAGTDYTAASGSLHFPAEADAATPADAIIQPIAVPILHNPATTPATADFSVALSLPSGSDAVLGSPSSETVTIVNIDGTPTVQWSAASYSVDENAGSVRLLVIAAGTIPSSGEVDVDYATAAGSAKPDVNYTSQSDTLQFFADDVAEAIDIPILDDGKSGSTSFTAGLTGPVGGALGAPSTATVNIRDLTITPPNTSPTVGTTPSGDTPTSPGPSGNPGGQIVLGVRQSVCGLTVKAAKKQKLLKKKTLVLKLRSNQACKVSLATTIKQLKAKKHRKAGHAARALRFKGKKSSLSLQPNKAKTVKVRFTKKTLKAIKKALRARKRLVATVVVTERVGSAPAKKRTLKITIRR